MEWQKDSMKKPLSFSELRDNVASYFDVLDSYIDPKGVPTFTLTSSNFKLHFKKMTMELEKYELIPMLRREMDLIILRIFSKPPIKHKSRTWLNLILFGITIGTIFIAGYWGFISTPILKEILLKDANVYLQAGLFAVCLFGIIGIHELGHMTACKIHGLNFSLPYFIPGPPPIGTFGAIVSLRSPPKNKDELFDTGFSGPLFGFIATLIVASISLKTGFLVPLEQAIRWGEEGLVQTASWPRYPFLFDLLLPVIRPIPEGYSLILTQLEFAAWVGALITFLNILPVWQLDGGHISRAALGSKGHKIASIIGLIILFTTGYWFFAIFILLWMYTSGRGFRGAEPLDDVSPLSSSRKMLYILSLGILVLCFVTLSIF